MVHFGHTPSENLTVRDRRFSSGKCIADSRKKGSSYFFSRLFFPPPNIPKGVGCKNQGCSRVMTPTRGSDQELFKIPWDGSGRVGSGRARRFFNYHGSSPVTVNRPDPTWPARFDPTHERPGQDPVKVNKFSRLLGVLYDGRFKRANTLLILILPVAITADRERQSTVHIYTGFSDPRRGNPHNIPSMTSIQSLHATSKSV